MMVLRAHHSELLTIVEVFLHDPLYKWNLRISKSLKGGKENGVKNEKSEGSGNKDAEKTLHRLKQKLQGVEYGEVLSVRFYFFIFRFIFIFFEY